VAISQAKGDIAKDVGFSDVQMGAVFGAFGLAYALFEIPTGWLGDKIGARKVLTRVVLWWSFFTAATGWAGSYVSMWWTRFLFGAGEAGCFPNLTKAFSNGDGNRQADDAIASLRRLFAGRGRDTRCNVRWRLSAHVGVRQRARRITSAHLRILDK
jgi:MFS family permease